MASSQSEHLSVEDFVEATVKDLALICACASWTSNIPNDCLGVVLRQSNTVRNSVVLLNTGPSVKRCLTFVIRR